MRIQGWLYGMGLSIFYYRLREEQESDTTRIKSSYMWRKYKGNVKVFHECLQDVYNEVHGNLILLKIQCCVSVLRYWNARCKSKLRFKNFDFNFYTWNNRDQQIKQSLPKFLDLQSWFNILHMYLILCIMWHRCCYCWILLIILYVLLSVIVSYNNIYCFYYIRNLNYSSEYYLRQLLYIKVNTDNRYYHRPPALAYCRKKWFPWNVLKQNVYSRLQNTERSGILKINSELHNRRKDAIQMSYCQLFIVFCTKLHISLRCVYSNDTKL